MAITKNGARQYPICARTTFTYADAGTAVVASPNPLEVMDIPVGAIIIGGHFTVTTAWVGPTVATADIGDGGDTDRYTTTGGPIDLKTLGCTPLEIDGPEGGYKYTAQDTIDIDYVLTVAPASAGAAELVVYYIIEDRAHEVQPV